MNIETENKILGNLETLHANKILKVLDGMYDGYKAGVGVNEMQFKQLRDTIISEINKLTNEKNLLKNL